MNSSGTARPRLALNTFGIAFGTAGLAGTWTTASAELQSPAVVGDVLWIVAALVAATLLVGTIAVRSVGLLRAGRVPARPAG
jgi:tellurite resistance protein